MENKSPSKLFAEENWWAQRQNPQETELTDLPFARNLESRQYQRKVPFSSQNQIRYKQFVVGQAQLGIHDSANLAAGTDNAEDPQKSVYCHKTFLAHDACHEKNEEDV